MSAAPIRLDSIMSTALAALAVMALSAPTPVTAQEGGEPDDLTYSRDIAPILQRSCVNCHRPNGVAPMALTRYEEVRRHARQIVRRTAIRYRMGTMPPWYAEKDVGIQNYKNDPSLSDEEVAMIAEWAGAGAPAGDPADMPPPLEFDDSGAWTLGEPDLVVTTDEFLVEDGEPDWWGDISPVGIPVETDRYVKSV